MGDLTRTQQSQPVQITDDSSSLAALSTGPAGTEVGLVVRNIPFGTQTVAGTVTTNADANVAPGSAPSKVLVGGLIYNTATPAPTNGQAVALQADSSGNLKVNVTNTAAQIMSSSPTGTELGVVTRNIPSGTQTIAGDLSQGSANSGSPVQIGGRAAATISNASTVSDGQRVGAMMDKQGRVVTAQYGDRLNVQVASDSTTTTTARTLLAAQGTNVFSDLSSLVISNGSASAQLVTVSDGTKNYQFQLVANTNVQFNFPIPAPAKTANTAWTWTIGTAASTVYVNAIFVNTL